VTSVAAGAAVGGGAAVAAAATAALLDPETSASSRICRLADRCASGATSDDSCVLCLPLMLPNLFGNEPRRRGRTCTTGQMRDHQVLGLETKQRLLHEGARCRCSKESRCQSKCKHADLVPDADGCGETHGAPVGHSAREDSQHPTGNGVQLLSSTCRGGCRCSWEPCPRSKPQR